MDRAPGRIGFMSTQRRENRPTPATKMIRRGDRFRNRQAGSVPRARNFASQGEVLIAQVKFENTDSAAGGLTALISCGHKLSAIGSPHQSTRSACSRESLRWLPPSKAGASRNELQRVRPSGSPTSSSPLPVLRVSIPSCRGSRQH